MKNTVLLFAILLIYATTHAQNVASRIPNSPYPVTVRPDTLLMVNIDLFTQTQQLTVVTLQGLLAKTKPRIMITRGTPAFRSDLQNNYGVTYDSTYFNDFAGLMNHFKPEVSGYVLCNMGDTSTNGAISVCGFYNAVVASAADTALLDSLGIPQVYNMIGKGQIWAFDTFRTEYNKRIISYQNVSKCTYLSDYSVYAGAYQMYDVIPLSPLADSAFGNLQPNSAAFGWADEFTFVYQASLHGTHVHASDFCNNLSTFSNFSAPAVQKNHSVDTLIKPGVHTVCFLMSDGDNVQWLMGTFANGNNWYGSNKRGTLNMGWTVSPALAELAPTELKYMYDTAATLPNGMDVFVAGPSGMGYVYPDYFNPLDSAAAITGRMMKKADMSILNIIGNSWQDIYFEPYLNQPDIDAIFYYDYNDFYFGEHGLSTCINGKPVISARYDLVTGYFSVDTLAKLLNNQVKDPTSVDGYTLVAVNAWDDGMDSLVACYQKLDSTVRVVTPDAFVKLYKQGTGCNNTTAVMPQPVSTKGIELSCLPNPCSTSSDVTYTIAQTGPVELLLCDAFGRKVRTLVSGLQNAGTHQITLDTRALPAGMYFYTLQGDGFRKTARFVVGK